MQPDLANISRIADSLGFVLEEYQPHMLGERFLTRPIGGGVKYTLLARRSTDNARVVIKASNDPKGAEELVHERRCRDVLEAIRFAYGTFLSPREVLFANRGGYTLLITEFIEARPFLEMPIEMQFALALKAFKAQEGAHATTASHLRTIKSAFQEMSAALYYDKIQRYAQDTIGLLPRDTEIYKKYGRLSDQAIRLVSDNLGVLDQYGMFLTHWDFTPQNIRVAGSDIYLLDHSSIHFGNKYEGWARFINFMELYNPPLARALVQYVRDNRTAEEVLALKVMRVYRLMELIRYYTTWLSKTDGDLQTLAAARINFWSDILQCVLADEEVQSTIVDSYKRTRDSLRSEEEKKRQVGLH